MIMCVLLYWLLSASHFQQVEWSGIRRRSDGHGEEHWSFHTTFSTTHMSNLCWATSKHILISICCWYDNWPPSSSRWHPANISSFGRKNCRFSAYSLWVVYGSSNYKRYRKKLGAVISCSMKSPNENLKYLIHTLFFTQTYLLLWLESIFL